MRHGAGAASSPTQAEVLLGSRLHLGRGWWMDVETVVAWTAVAFELMGVAAMVAATVIALVVMRTDVGRGTNEVFRGLRLRVGRGILLGLEFLVAADILRTIATIPSMERMAILAAIIGVRTFLSLSLELEIEGRWPWQGRSEPEGAQPSR